MKLSNFFFILSVLRCRITKTSVLTPAFEPHTCCFNFYQKKIPAHVVQSFRHTDEQCVMRGVIITMTNNKEICVDPSMEWVKKLVNDVQ
uniref:Chemokine interleukin-8-like domain-containing protein n=1 Tax=Oryzias melastigma TaxID=30732 RepID=A0A3B3DVG4_ORYME